MRSREQQFSQWHPAPQETVQYLEHWILQILSEFFTRPKGKYDFDVILEQKQPEM